MLLILCMGIAKGTADIVVVFLFQNQIDNAGVTSRRVFSSWCLDDFYLLHIVCRIGLQNLQHFLLSHVLLLIVDAEDDARSPKQADIIIVEHHARRITQQIGSIDGSDNVTGVENNLSCLTTQDRRLSFYRHALQHLGLRVHPDGAELKAATTLEYGFVSNIGDTDYDGTHITWDDEVACLIAHASINYG